MPIEPWLLELLVCPRTKVPLRELPQSVVLGLNELIVEGKLTYVGGSPVEYPMDGALISIDLETIYAVRDSVPILLVEEGIPARHATFLLDCPD